MLKLKPRPKKYSPTKGLRVINFVVSCVLKSNIFNCAAAVTTKHRENVTIISSNNSLLALVAKVGDHATCFILS